MNEFGSRTFPLKGIPVHRPFDQTIESICTDSMEKYKQAKKAAEENKNENERQEALTKAEKIEIKRRAFSARLQSSTTFGNLFYPDPLASSEYRFPMSDKDNKDSYALNFHWETVPLIRSYNYAKTKWRWSTDGERENEVFDLLNAYKTALTNEEGRFFSAFRDTDPLYCNLVMKEQILKLIPERISLLIVTAMLGSSVGGVGRLIATIQILDDLIDQNIVAILNNCSDSDDIPQIIKQTFDSFNFEKSVEGLYERLEKERPAESPDATFEYEGKVHRTFGIKLYSETFPEDKAYLDIIFDYLDAADKENKETRKSYKDKKKEAEKNYDAYRCLHLQAESYRAEEFRRSSAIIDHFSPRKKESIFENNQTLSKRTIIQLSIINMLRTAGYIHNAPQSTIEQKIAESSSFLYIEDPALFSDIESISSGVMQNIYWLCLEVNSFVQRAVAPSYSLRLFSNLLCTEVLKIDKPVSNHNKHEYYDATLQYFYSVSPMYPDILSGFFIDENDISSIVNSSEESDIYEFGSKENFDVFAQRILFAWIVNLAGQKADEYINEISKINNVRHALYQKLYDGKQDEDKRNTDPISRAFSDLFTRLFGAG